MGMCAGHYQSKITVLWTLTAQAEGTLNQFDPRCGPPQPW
jgi:hypothetical protein